jgi:hypothetical protein
MKDVTPLGSSVGSSREMSHRPSVFLISRAFLDYVTQGIKVKRLDGKRTASAEKSRGYK